jgi:hypothetical protein
MVRAVTAILPQIGQSPPFRAGPADEARADPPPRMDFESLLDQVGTDSGKNGRGMSASEFDAFGFFGSTGAPPTEVGAPENRESPQAPRAGETSSTPAEPTDAPEQPAAIDDRAPAELAAAAGDTPARETGDAAGRGPVAAPFSTVRANGAAVRGGPETLPAAGVQGHQSAPSVTQGCDSREDVPAGPRAGAAPVERQSADRLVLSLSDEAVELTGHLPGLGEDDEQRLLNALGELLESHGLILGSALINGRPIAGARTVKEES